MSVQVLHGDSRDLLKSLPDASIDSVVCDPPYALVSITKRWGGDGPPTTSTGAYKRASSGFMGKQWDTGETAFDSAFWVEVLRVMKPGAHLVAFGGTRTFHRLVCSIEDAGFEIRDQLAWLFGSGFPKSHDVAKAIDKAAGVDIPTKVAGGGSVNSYGDGLNVQWESRTSHQPFCESAQEWAGWGTALKPAHEPICLARKPLESTVAGNVLKHGTGALNIDACRVEHGEECRMMEASQANSPSDKHRQAGRREAVLELKPGGRWPANVIHDGSPEVLAGFPDTGLSSGGSGSASQRTALAGHVYGEYSGSALGANAGGIGDSGSAARFFYTPKADKLDRLESKHPTVKPVDLMAYLIKLVTPKGGVVLDPFAGSGSTGMAAMREGFECILMEREAEYVADIQRRLSHVHGDDLPLFEEAPQVKQADLFAGGAK